MNEKVQIKNNMIISYNKIKNDLFKNCIDYESNKNNSFSIEYSMEEMNSSTKMQKNDIEKININDLESIRLSLTFGDKDSNPKILLNRIIGIKSPEKKQKKIIKNNNNYFQKLLKQNENEINIINAVNTNKGFDNMDDNKNIYIDTEELYSAENYSLNNKENDNIDSEKYSIKKDNNNNYNFNYEESENERKKEDTIIFKKQNELFIQLLDSYDINNKKNKRNVIISNLNEDLINLNNNTKNSINIDDRTKGRKSNGIKNDTPKVQKNRDSEKKVQKIKADNLQENISFQNINRRNKVNIPIKKILTNNKLNNLNTKNKIIIRRTSINNILNIQNKSVINKSYINKNVKNLKLKSNNSSMNSIRHKYTKNINTINDNIIKKYKTKINLTKENNKINNKDKDRQSFNKYKSGNYNKKYSINENNNLFKIIPFFEINKSIKLLLDRNKSYNTTRNLNKYINNNHNDCAKNKNKMNISKHKNNIPIYNKKIFNNYLSKRIHTEINNSQKSLNSINSFKRLKINSKNKLITGENNKKIKLNVIKILNECNNILLDNKIITKNNSFNINKNVRNKSIRNNGKISSIKNISKNKNIKFKK